MSRETLLAELQAMAGTAEATPAAVRQHARERLNGSMVGHPLIVHATNGPAMRIEVEGESTIWVSVPRHWLLLEP